TREVAATPRIADGRSHAHEVVGDSVFGGSAVDHASALEHDRVVAETGYRAHVVAHEKDGATASRHLLDTGVGPGLKLGVADGEHLVEEQDLGVEVRGDGERESHLHPRRIPLDGDVDEVADTGEVDDLVELPPGLCTRHAEDRAVEEDVVSPRQLGMKAGAYFEQTADTPMDLDAATGRLRDAAQDREQRGFPGTV